MAALEEFATSNSFFASEGLTTRTLRQRLERELRFEDDLDLHWFGNDGKDFIHLSTLKKSAKP